MPQSVKCPGVYKKLKTGGGLGGTLGHLSSLHAASTYTTYKRSKYSVGLVILMAQTVEH